MKCWSSFLGITFFAIEAHGQEYLEPRQMQGCLSSPVNEVHATTVYVTPTSISTYITANTIFNIDGNAAITINNAPTLLTTTITVTNTVVATVTVPTTIVSVPSSAGTVFESLPEPFFLQTVSLTSARLRRRQGSFTIGGYAQGDHLTATCREGTLFVLNSGQLYSGGELVSTSPNINFSPFLTGGQGPINTGFSVEAGVLSWNSQFFFGGTAGFCVTPDNTLNAVFDRRFVPRDCLFIALRVVRLSRCPTTPFPMSNSTSFPLPTGTISRNFTSSLGPTAPLPTEITSRNSTSWLNPTAPLSSQNGTISTLSTASATFSVSSNNISSTGPTGAGGSSLLLPSANATSSILPVVT